MADKNNNDGVVNQTPPPPPPLPTDPTQSPYYLHSRESLGFVIVQPPFSSEKNYYHWSRAMRRMLS